MDITALYRRYGAMVTNRCRMLLGNDADAQEACQEVFLKLHRYRHSFRGEASPSTYMYKVTTTTCLNRIRSRRRRPEVPVEQMPVRPPAEGFHNVSPMRHVELRQLVDKLLDGQDERTQSCVIYHYIDGMTHREVGELLGVSAAAVRKRISRFRVSVRDNPPSWLDEETLE
ncbi:MAG: RNA polymerase sigma-70 factor (ECF subfamily) [Kiritimatiellia bacterium]|jgi:RNA polymerase sigma-70 factor (ECF subfamily)